MKWFPGIIDRHGNRLLYEDVDVRIEPVHPIALLPRELFDDAHLLKLDYRASCRCKCTIEVLRSSSNGQHWSFKRVVEEPLRCGGRATGMKLLPPTKQCC